MDSRGELPDPGQKPRTDSTSLRAGIDVVSLNVSVKHRANRPASNLNARYWILKLLNS